MMAPFAPVVTAASAQSPRTASIAASRLAVL